jgi:hypothetical protein
MFSAHRIGVRSFHHDVPCIAVEGVHDHFHVLMLRAFAESLGVYRADIPVPFRGFIAAVLNRQSHPAPPLLSGGFGADCFLITSKGTKVKRWGSVRQAGKILGGCDRESVYVLIAAGLLDAYKLQPHRPNSHWRVDLVGCQLHKNGQLAGSAKAG